MPFWSRRRVRWIREGIRQYVPYLPYNPKPKPPPPYVPPAPVMVITAPTAGQTVTTATPTLRGTAPGAGTVTVVIKQGATTVQTLTPTASGGTWAATAASLSDNNYTVTATQTVSGSPITSGPSAFTVDAVATPPSSVIIMSPAAGATVQDDTPPIVGSAPGGTTVTVTVSQGATLLQTLTATPSGGTWQVTAASLPDGVYQIGASQVGAGNATPVTFTVDVPQPAVTITSVAGGPPGSATNDTTPAINGTGQNRAGDATTVDVTVRQGATVVQTHTGVPLLGTVWSKTLTTALAVGSYQVRATQASSFGTGTSSDFPFTVTTAPVVPAPAITGPTEGQTLAGNPISFTGTAGNAGGDSTLVTVRVYPAGSSSASYSQSVNRSGAAWSMSFTATVPNGGWQARVEQTGTAGVGVSALRQFTMAIPSGAPGLAMPRGPVNGFAGAADFYDSVGVCHHPDYFGNNATQRSTGIARLQELGVRHVRLGLVSPANHGNIQVQQEGSQFFAKDLRAANTARNPATTQPVFGLFGTTGEPRYEFDRPNSAVYTIATFLRPLTGPTGSVPNRSGVTPFGPQIKLLENAGSYYDVGWEAAGGLQGPNEPDARVFYPTNIRDTIRGLRDAKNAAAGEVVLGGEPYVNSVTGRIVAGPAHAPQLPIVAFALTGNNWSAMGDYSDGLDANVGSPHMYWGGHSPIYDEYHALTSGSNWGTQLSYNGFLFNGVRFSRMLPRFITETGYIQKPGSDPGGGERYTPAEVVGEFYIRTLIQNYVAGIRRTFLFSLNDISQGTYGMLAQDWTYRASFYAVKNMLGLVGFVQGNSSTPITVPHTFTAGGADLVGMPSKSGGIVDRLDKVILQRSDTEYLIVLTRQKQLWHRDNQAYVVPTATPVVLTLPSGTWTCSVAEPAKNQLLDPNDALTYPNPGNGTAFSATGVATDDLTPDAQNKITVQMAGLTRVVKIVKNTSDALHTRVVSELNEFANWTMSNSVQGAVTEFGVPTNTDDPTVTDADVDEWAGLLETYYQRLQATGLHSLQWVASEVSVGELSTYLSPSYGSALNRAMAAAGPLEAHANDALMYRGIALTGLDFTQAGFSNTNPGALHSNYFAASQGSWTYLRSRGVKVARVGFRWERLQPALGGALNGTYLQAIRDQVTRANVAGVDVVLDCHNYGGYITSSGQLKLGSAGLTSAHFADLWRRLALEFASNARVVAYEIMNEPEGMPGGGASWRTISQSCVNQIRAVDGSTAIWVAGYNWSKVQGWLGANGGAAWITGHTGIVYVAHHYFDTESSLNLGGPAADSGYAQTYSSAVADSAAITPPPAAPPSATTIHVIGDTHIGRPTGLSRANQVVADLTSVAARVQIGDFVENSPPPSYDAAANTWANSFPGAFYGVAGNHDVGGPTSNRTAEAAVDAFTSWTNRTPNWSVDLGFARMIGMKPERIDRLSPAPFGPQGGRVAMWVSQTTIDYVGGQAAANPAKTCVVFVHCPLAGTVLGNNAVEYSSDSSINQDFSLQPEAAINTMLNAHPNIKVVVSGHTHSSTDGTVPGIVTMKDVGGRSVICVNASATAYTRRGQQELAVKTFYLSLTSTQLEVRVRDHTAQAWSNFGGANVTTVALPA